MESMERKGTCIRRIDKKREVWRVTVAGDTFYVKCSRYSPVSRLLVGLRLKGLGREAAMCAELKIRGVPIPTLVAYGRKKGRLPDEESTRFKALPYGQKKGLTKDLALFFRDLHDTGVLHTDPHTGNILVTTEDGKNRFYLLDLGEVKLRPSAKLNERWSNLVVFNINFITNARDSLRYYFFKCYTEGLIDDRKTFKEIIKKIEKDSMVLASKVWKKKTRRCMGNNRLFLRDTSNGLVVCLKREWDKATGIHGIISSPDDFLDGEGARVLKDGRTIKAGVVELKGGGRIFLKRYNRKGLFHTFKNIFRASRAQRVWEKSYGLELRGFNVPRPIAYMEERRFRILKRSYVISEFLSGAVNLNEFIGQQVMSDDERAEVISALGREIGRMHRFGWFHGDLKWNNILVNETSGRERAFYFLDIDGSKIKRDLNLNDVSRDIGRFFREMERYGLGTDRKHLFLSAYLRQNRTGLSYDNFVKAVERRVKAKRSVVN
jgi:tRNA A-37 threonylcarbamoyl transferase component Bud32